MSIDWTQILKIISSSKNITIAFFVTSLVLTVGHNIDIRFVPKVSEEVYVYAFAILVFSTSLLVTLVFAEIYKCVVCSVQAYRLKHKQNNLTDIEKLVLVHFIDLGNGFLRIDYFQKYSEHYQKAEFAQAFNTLEDKGLIKVQFNRESCQATKDGMKIAVKLFNEGYKNQS